MFVRLERQYAPLGLADVSAQKQSQTQATAGTQLLLSTLTLPITVRSLQSVECKSKCDGEAVLCLGAVCGNGKLPGHNDEIEGAKELGTMGESDDNLANEVMGMVLGSEFEFEFELEDRVGMWCGVGGRWLLLW
jgi:hypothetical protein